MWWPLSVSTPARSTGAPAQGAKRRVTCAAAIGITSTGSGKRPSVATSLDLVGDADEALGQVGDDLLARQRGAAALDHVAAGSISSAPSM
jgi:hypothetical protein